MAACSCCHIRTVGRWQVLLVISGIILAGTSVWLMLVVDGAPRDNFQCILTSYQQLTSSMLANPDVVVGSQAANLHVSQYVLDRTQDGLDNIRLVSFAPGASCAALLLLTALTSSCGQKASNRCVPLSKILVVLALLLLLVNIAYFAVLGGIGLLSSKSVIQDQWAKVSATCRDNADDLQTQLVGAQTQLSLAKASGADVSAYATNVATAQVQCAEPSLATHPSHSLELAQTCSHCSIPTSVHSREPHPSPFTPPISSQPNAPQPTHPTLQDVNVWYHVHLHVRGQHSLPVAIWA